jgi:SAM-dependent methyltransferase
VSPLVPGFLKPVVRPAARLILAGPPRGRPLRPAPAASRPPYPPDVSDEVELRAFLMANAAVFGHRREAEAYLADSLERFRVTMALLPPLPAGARVLELGANPYFITRLLRRRGLRVTCANWFGDEFQAREHRQVIPDGHGGEQVFDFDHFNVERDRFPYPDRSFDLVLFCEILEHLPADPVHALAEIHRVLEAGGRLLLTTPNAVRSDRLARMQRGENVYEELSGYGVYGRHNREYTVEELERLLTELGYQVDTVMDLDVHPGGEVPASWPPGVERAHRGDNLFCLARPDGEPRWRYPAWLFNSVHDLYGRKVVRPDLVVGLNDELQSSGLSEREALDGAEVRWTGPAPARVMLEASFGGPGRIRVEGLAPPPAAGPAEVRLRARWERGEASWPVPADARPFSLTAPIEVAPGRLEVTLATDRTWPRGGAGPAAGVGIRAVALLPPG